MEISFFARSSRLPLAVVRPPWALPGGRSDCDLAGRRIGVRDPDDARQHAGQSAHSVQQRPDRGRKFLPCTLGFNCVSASVKSASHITKSTAGRRRQPVAAPPAQRRGHRQWPVRASRRVAAQTRRCLPFCAAARRTAWGARATRCSAAIFRMHTWYSALRHAGRNVLICHGRDLSKAIEIATIEHLHCGAKDFNTILFGH